MTEFSTRRTPELMTFPEGNPLRCTRVPHHSNQTFYWRSFTQKGLDGFRQNNYVSVVPSLVNVSTQQFENGSFEVATRDTELPGVLWTSHDPMFAFAVGLMRMVTENQPVYLLGVNYCYHDSEQGVLAYKAVGAGKNNRVLYPLDHTDMDRKGWTHGTVFNKFSPQQMEQGVLYKFDESFVDTVRSVYDAYPYTKGSIPHNISKLIQSTLYKNSLAMGVYEEFTKDNHLNELFLAFLTPAKIKGLPTRDMKGAALAKNKIESDFLKRMFIEKMQKERLAEQMREAEQVVYYRLGAASHHRKIEAAYLTAKSRTLDNNSSDAASVREEEDLRAMLDLMNRFSDFPPGATPFADFEEWKLKK